MPIRLIRKYCSPTAGDCEHGYSEPLEAPGTPGPRRWSRHWPLFMFIPMALYFYIEATESQPIPMMIIAPQKWTNNETQAPKTVEDNQSNDYDVVIRRHTYKLQIDKIKTKIPAPPSFTTFGLTTLNFCSKISPSLINFELQLSNFTESLNDIYPTVQAGGYYRPVHCLPKHKVAILVPYRNESSLLSTFLYNMHPLLMAQQIEYKIYVIEQYGDTDFNKGRLLNTGYSEMLKSIKEQWSCVVLHDVNLLPASLNVSYECLPDPMHLSCAIDADKDPMKTNEISKAKCSGVCMLTVEQYAAVNGYSNMNWESGKQDTDFSERLNNAGLYVKSCNKEAEKYIALPHEKRRSNLLSRLLLQPAKARPQCDGWQTTHYKLILAEKKHLYTRLLVDVDQYGDTREEKAVTNGTRENSYRYNYGPESVLTR